MSNKNEQNAIDVKQKNVFHKPLARHFSPRTSAPSLPSSLHPGFCTSTTPIAATLTASFLDFSASHGVDLRKTGVSPGARYCIEARTWKEAVDSGMADAPRVKLECTHEAALESVGMDVLGRWKADQDIDSGAVWPKDTKGGVGKQSGEIGGKEPKS